MHTGRPAPAVDDAALGRAAALLRAGGLVAFPTETVYGLGANALDEQAVARVFEVKGRPRFDPLIVHIASAEQARGCTAAWPEVAGRLAEAFWPGPMTLVLAKVPSPAAETGPSRPGTEAARKLAIPDLVTAGLPTVALRVPAHPVALALLRAADVPVAAPSANRFGGVSPTTAEHVRSELGEQVAMVLDGGPCRTGVESTVVSLVEPERPTVLRLGGLAVEWIEQVIGAVALAEPRAAGAAAHERGQASPGMLERHYAPGTPMRLAARVAEVPAAVEQFVAASPRVRGSRPIRLGLLVNGADAGKAAAEACEGMAGQVAGCKVAVVEVLSAGGGLVEAAANLFAAMRRLDAAGLDLIVAVRVADEGLGRAINDRLRRASTA